MDTLTLRLERWFSTEPDAPAFHFAATGHQDVTVTWRAIDLTSRRLVACLARKGVAVGDTVAILVEQSPELVYSFVACLRLGAIPTILPVPSNRLHPEQWKRGFEGLQATCSPRCVIAGEALAAVLERNGLLAASTVLLRPEDALAEESIADVPFPCGECDSIALLQHSSGTTGMQKGVALTHGAVLSHVDAYAKEIRLSQSDVVVSWLPLYHDMGLIACLMLPLMTRTRLVLMSPFDWVLNPALLFQTISRHLGTLVWLPNFGYNFCAKRIRDTDLGGVRLDSLRAVINCSEPMRIDSHRMFHERFAPYGLRFDALATCYAMAENTFAVTQGGIRGPVVTDTIDRTGLSRSGTAVPVDPGDPKGITLLSVGTPLDGVEIRMVDALRSETGERQVGEIAIRSPWMLHGYYRRPDLDAEAIVDGMYFTGDLGYRVGREYFVTGRKKDLIIVAGSNYYPHDIEAAAGEVPGVIEGRSAAFGWTNHETGTEEIVLIVETETPDGPESLRIRSRIHGSIADATGCSVSRVVLVPPRWLVKTSSGKVARSANRERLLQMGLAAQCGLGDGGIA